MPHCANEFLRKFCLSGPGVNSPNLGFEAASFEFDADGLHHHIERGFRCPVAIPAPNLIFIDASYHGRKCQQHGGG